MIYVDGSRRRAPSIIAPRTEDDRPAGVGSLCCWLTLRYKGGSRAVVMAERGCSASCRSAAGAPLFHLNEQTQTATCCCG